VSRLSLEFTKPEVAGFSMVQYGQDVYWPIGLDGKYREAADGQAQVGYWEDADTFVIEIFDVGQLTRKLSFDGNKLQVNVPEIDFNIDCQVESP
jgi:hypothetical protein